MATKRPAKSLRTPLDEAVDPATDPERLRQLSDLKNEAVCRAAWKNPSLPEDVWRETLLEGQPEAWANPMAPIYLLTWENDRSTLEEAAQLATIAIWRDPGRCLLEENILITAKLQERWVTSEQADTMMWLLGWWGQAKGNGSVEHREVVRILVVCVRTAPQPHRKGSSRPGSPGDLDGRRRGSTQESRSLGPIPGCQIHCLVCAGSFHQSVGRN